MNKKERSLGDHFDQDYHTTQKNQKHSMNLFLFFHPNMKKITLFFSKDHFMSIALKIHVTLGEAPKIIQKGICIQDRSTKFVVFSSKFGVQKKVGGQKSKNL